MISTKTVFILGAGASKPYNYPTGEELRKDIFSCFVKDYIRFLQRVSSKDIPTLHLKYRNFKVYKFGSINRATTLKFL